MEKDQFLQIVQSLVEGFEKPDFQEALKSAKARGDIEKLLMLPTSLQAAVFASYGLEPTAAMAAFKEAGRKYAMEPEAGPFMARMRQALAVIS